MVGASFTSRSSPHCLAAAALAGLLPLVGCGAAAPGRSAPHDADTIRTAGGLPAADGRDVCLVGRYGPMTLDAHLGDPARAPGYMVIWIGHQPVRLGLEPRPAEERERLLDETVAVRGVLRLAPAEPTGGPTSALPLLEPLRAPVITDAPGAPAEPITGPLLLPGASAPPTAP